MIKLPLIVVLLTWFMSCELGKDNSLPEPEVPEINKEGVILRYIEIVHTDSAFDTITTIDTVYRTFADSPIVLYHIAKVPALPTIQMDIPDSTGENSRIEVMQQEYKMLIFFN